MNQTKNSPGGEPTAFIFSEIDDLSFSLCKRLLEKNCLVKIFCSDTKGWQSAIAGGGLRGVEALKIFSRPTGSKPYYLIYQLNSFKLSEKNFKKVENQETKKLSFIVKLVGETKAKTVLLFPADQKAKPLVDRLFLGPQADVAREAGISILYFDRTIGPYFNSSVDGHFGKMIKQALEGGPVEVASGAIGFSLGSSDKVADVALKILFSFGEWQEVNIVGPEIPFQEFFRKLQFLDSSLASREVQMPPPSPFGAKQRLLVDGPKDEDILAALLPLKKQSHTRKITGKYFEDTKRNILYLVFSVGIFLLLPYLVLFVGLGFLLGASQLIQKQNLVGAETAIFLSEKLATTSRQGFSTLTAIPGGQSFFGPGLGISDALQRGANVGHHLVLAFRKGETLSNGFFSKQGSDLPLASKEISLELDYIYTEVGFLQGDLVTLQSQIPFALDWEKISQDVSTLRTKIFYVRDLVAELPWLLGDTEKRLYLILFQNNMELRPTGGYIGSFALVNIQDGKLIDLEVQDVFSADGQLKGHVEPPEPIKKYLGEAGWFLRDSNWDPEFSISAQRAEWFLDKEIGISLDGVIGIDLEAVKKLLDVTGEIKLEDYSKTISSNNLFDETRSQIEQNFFPGSRTKASFLTSLSSSLLSKISEPSGVSRVDLARAIILGLEEKNIQVFLHNGRALKSIELLGWAGGLPTTSCGETCFGDWVGISEANVGVNKANYYIERSVDLSINLNEEQVKRTLTITWRNKAPRGAGEKGRYKAYVRLLAPGGGNFGEGQKRLGQSVVGFVPETQNIRGHEEAGTIVEVFPGESSTLSFNWIHPAELSSQTGEYVLNVRKQPGTQADPWQIKIVSNFGKKLQGNPVFSLTGPDQFGYNTFLARDFISRVWW
jgi:hypothetical protein